MYISFLNLNTMRLLILALSLLLVAPAYSQPFRKSLISGLVVNADTVPISDVAIINVRTGKTARTNASGFFQTEINDEDSLFVYHIAYKNKFINKQASGKLIFLKAEIQELEQVDVTDKFRIQKKYLFQTVEEIKRQAPLKIYPENDDEMRQLEFTQEHGSHDNVIRPFFGPTFKIPLENFTSLIFKTEEEKELKRLTQQSNLVRKNK